MFDRKAFLIGAIIFALITGLKVWIVPANIHAQEEMANLSLLLQKLDDQEATLYVDFVAPVNGEDSWLIPDTFEDENGIIVGRRLLKEVGEDYLCTAEIGQGLTSLECVPFSNIAYLSTHIS